MTRKRQTFTYNVQDLETFLELIWFRNYHEAESKTVTFRSKVYNLVLKWLFIVSPSLFIAIISLKYNIVLMLKENRLCTGALTF